MKMKAEAKVQLRTRLRTDLPWSDWADSLDFDPINLPVESVETTDVFDDSVMALSEGIVQAEAGFAEGATNLMTEYRVVWSATGHDVRGVCPACDDVFPIAEGFPGDTYNEGYDAVCCGCV